MSDYESQFPMIIQLLNNSNLEQISEIFDKYLEHKNTNFNFPFYNVQISLEMIKFLNGLIPIIEIDNDEKNLNSLNSVLERLNIKNNENDNNSISKLLLSKILSFKKNKFNSSLLNFEWQIGVIDRKNDNVNLNKSEKIEILTKFNHFDLKEQKYKSDLVKLNYNEFEEILNNFKKIDEQLHLFKQ